MMTMWLCQMPLIVLWNLSRNIQSMVLATAPTSTLLRSRKGIGWGLFFGELKTPDFEERGFLIPLLESNFLGGAALFVRTSCYKQLGHFDPKLLRSQDYEMAIRIARRFKGIEVAGGPTFHYRQHAGIRGGRQDQFVESDRFKKWLEYDQVFFRKLYLELPLTEYLPAEKSLEEHTRQALLQRMGIMASKNLVEEVMSDLHDLSRVTDRTSLSRREKIIIRDTFYYRLVCIIGYLGFFDEICRLSASSEVIRLLRKQILLEILARFKREFNLSLIKNSLRHIYHLYF